MDAPFDLDVNLVMNPRLDCVLARDQYRRDKLPPPQLAINVDGIQE